MNPAEHTTHESKTLGLNRNHGEVIELRLRTDSYDGYRDYKIIRKTLCHELSHNVWVTSAFVSEDFFCGLRRTALANRSSQGDHDRNFWNLTKEIEEEVHRNDTLHGGHRLSNQEFYNPNDTYHESEHADHGGWTGGDFVLGGSAGEAGLNRREIVARAAEARLRKEREAQEHQDSPSPS